MREWDQGNRLIVFSDLAADKSLEETASSVEGPGACAWKRQSDCSATVGDRQGKVRTQQIMLLCCLPDDRGGLGRCSGGTEHEGAKKLDSVQVAGNAAVNGYNQLPGP